MTFNSLYLSQIDAGFNTSVSPRWSSYTDTTQTRATMIASAFFNSIASQIRLNDIIHVTGSDGIGLYYVTAITPNVTLGALVASA